MSAGPGETKIWARQLILHFFSLNSATLPGVAGPKLTFFPSSADMIHQGNLLKRVLECTVWSYSAIKVEEEKCHRAGKKIPPGQCPLYVEAISDRELAYNIPILQKIGFPILVIMLAYHNLKKT